MGQHAGTLNRVWLFVLGFLSLIAGVLLLLQANGLLASLTGLAVADPGSRVISGDLWAAAGRPETAVILWIVGIVAALLGLLWILAQVPRKGRAAPYRLHDGDAAGFTLCDTSVLAGALDASVSTLPGVVSSNSVLRGTADAPEVTTRLTVTDRADIQDLIRQIRTSALEELSTALETSDLRWRLQVDVSARPQSGTAVTSSGVVLQ